MTIVGQDKKTPPHYFKFENTRNHLCGPTKWQNHLELSVIKCSAVYFGLVIREKIGHVVPSQETEAAAH